MNRSHCEHCKQAHADVKDYGMLLCALCWIRKTKEIRQ